MNIEVVFEQFPILKSDVLLLKKIELDHLDELHEIYNNDKVFKYCGIIPRHNKHLVKNMIGNFERDYKRESKVKWGIFTNLRSERLLGIIEALEFNQKINMASINLFLVEGCWGNGIGTEAVRIMVKFLFQEVNVNRIQAEVMPQDEVSKKLLLKSGFIKEGTIRQATLWSGKGIVDIDLYSILSEDYVKRLKKG